MYFDAWQEMKGCSKEITDLAKEENPAFADYITFKDHISTTQGLSTLFNDPTSDYISSIRSFLDGTMEPVIPTMISRGVNCFMVRKLVLGYYKEHPDLARK